MFSSRYLFLCILILMIIISTFKLQCKENRSDLSRGFGDDINWLSLQEASENEDRKPYFILIHKSWCGACQRLKESLKDSLKFKELSERFHMINLEDDEEPKEEAYSPDGSYIPRLLFVDQSGNLRDEIYNELGNPNYKYFYSNDEQVIRSMEKALEVLYSEDELNNLNDYEDQYLDDQDDVLDNDDENDGDDDEGIQEFVDELHGEL